MELVSKLHEHWKSILCFVVHLFLLWAVFDTYYNSPLVHGMTPFGETADDVAPASRLVLFVADGLRAHSLYENVSRAPFLRKIMSSEGSWGVSHTRVPTESRPGHVALIAGFYEDVSAVTKGWQENPVEFDSVFNESRYTWSWGSPDILPMFAKGASGQRVFTHCYDSASEDFASSDASKLDTWVFDEVKAYFVAAESNETVATMMRQQKVVFFLHLLGLDTSGHGYKPLSKEYLRNIKVVDDGISEIYQTIERFFNYDGRTAYIFTSDHGMTDWGSHGAGEAHETMTPLIAWGAGIPSPNENPDFSESDSLDSSDSSVVSPGRKDVNQADIAPLMATLLGVNIPMNSVGLLPLGYLNATQRYKAWAACSTFRQLAEQMQIQRRRKYESSFRLLFNDFPDMTPAKLKLIMAEIDKLFYTQKRFPVAERLCHEWSPVAVEGLIYYHQYERRFLSVCVAFTFLFLELCVWRFASEAAAEDSDVEALSIKSIKLFFIGSAVAVTLFWTMSFPLARYLYGLIPLFLMAIAQPLWSHLLGRFRVTFPLSAVRSPSIASAEIKRWVISVFASESVILLFTVAVAIELLVWCFFYRWILSIGLWALIAWPLSNQLIGWDLRLAWTITCSVISVFPLLPTVGKSSNPELIFYTCVIVAIILVFAYVAYLYRKLTVGSEERTEDKAPLFGTDLILFGIVFVFIMVSGCINLTTSISIEQRRGSPFLNRLMSWLILVTSPWLTLFAKRDIRIRLCTLVVALFCPLTLMSVSYEPIFYVFLCLLLYLWLRIEEIIEHGNDPAQKEFVNHLLVAKRPLNVDDARRAYLFVFFVFLSFFGTGNIASINSFNPSFTAPFITVFSPFVMGALLLTKIAIPFLAVCSVLCGLEAMTSRSVGVLFWLIVMVSDGMALRFFFLLRDQGSWLDIGTSISHFVISSVTTLIVMILYHLAKALLTKSALSIVDTKRHML